MNIPLMKLNPEQTFQEQAIGTMCNFSMNILSPSVKLYRQAQDGMLSYLGQNCQYYMWGHKSICTVSAMAPDVISVAKGYLDRKAVSYIDTIQEQKTDMVILTDENKRPSAANKKLNTRHNGITDKRQYCQNHSKELNRNV